MAVLSPCQVLAPPVARSETVKRTFDANFPLQLQHECPHLSTNRVDASFTGAFGESARVLLA